MLISYEISNKIDVKRKLTIRNNYLTATPLFAERICLSARRHRFIGFVYQR